MRTFHFTSYHLPTNFDHHNKNFDGLGCGRFDLDFLKSVYHYRQSTVLYPLDVCSLKSLSFLYNLDSFIAKHSNALLFGFSMNHNNKKI